jgi:hypothetical protein
MEPERILKQLMDRTPRGTRPIECPKLRRKDQSILQGVERIERAKP